MKYLQNQEQKPSGRQTQFDPERSPLKRSKIFSNSDTTETQINKGKNEGCISSSKFVTPSDQIQRTLSRLEPRQNQQTPRKENDCNRFNTPMTKQPTSTSLSIGNEKVQPSDRTICARDETSTNEAHNEDSDNHNIEFGSPECDLENVQIPL